MKRRLFLFTVMLLTLVFTATAFAAYQRVADNTVPAYTNSALTQRIGNERVDKGDNVTVLQETGSAYYVRYPVKNGTKDRWVPKNIFNSSSNNTSRTNTASVSYVTLPDGWYRISPAHDLRRSMDAQGAAIGSSNNIHMWDSLDVPQQKFYLQNHGNSYFSLKDGYSNQYVTAVGSNNGSNLQTQPWKGSGNSVQMSQVFRLVNAGGGTYHIMASWANNTNLNFDCAGGAKANGTNVQLWSKESNSAHHKWKFTKVNMSSQQPSFQQYQKTATQTVPAYTNAALTQRNGSERVDAGDLITVLQESGNSLYVRYPAGNTTKERWVSKDVFAQPTQPSGDVKQKLLYAVFRNNGGRISCDFDGYKNTNGRHEGIDLVLSHNAPVYAAISGTVTKAGGGSYNTFAIYDSANDKTVVYLHFSSVAGGMYAGKYIEKGSLIGYQGNTGAPQGSHVHIEVRNGQKTAAAKSVNDPNLDNPNPYNYWNKVL